MHRNWTDLICLFLYLFVVHLMLLLCSEDYVVSSNPIIPSFSRTLPSFFIIGNKLQSTKHLVCSLFSSEVLIIKRGTYKYIQHLFPVISNSGFLCIYLENPFVLCVLQNFIQNIKCSRSFQVIQIQDFSQCGWTFWLSRSVIKCTKDLTSCQPLTRWNRTWRGGKCVE